jgi:hypothetical protein
VWLPMCISPGNGSVAPGDSLMFPITIAGAAEAVRLHDLSHVDVQSMAVHDRRR